MDWILHLIGACPDCAGHPTLLTPLAALPGGALAAWRLLKG